MASLGTSLNVIEQLHWWSISWRNKHGRFRMLANLQSDTLEAVASFLTCTELLQVTLSSKGMEANVEDASASLIANSGLRYDGKRGPSHLSQLHFLAEARLEFTWLLGSRISHVDGDRSRITSSNPDPVHSADYIAMRTMEGGHDWSGTDQTAVVRDIVMSSGRHYATFCTNGPMGRFQYFYTWCGIVRPLSRIWSHFDPAEFSPTSNPFMYESLLSEKTEAWAGSDVHCATYYSMEGSCVWSDWRGYGAKTKKFMGKGHFCSPFDTRELGLLLDLDEGTLTAYKGGTRLGVMIDGLAGDYVWVSHVLAQAHASPHCQNVQIKRGNVPGGDAGEESSSDNESSMDSDDVPLKGLSSLKKPRVHSAGPE